MNQRNYFKLVVLFLIVQSFAIANAFEIKNEVLGKDKIADLALTSSLEVIQEKAVPLVLNRVASGLRQKQVVFLWPNVYVLQVFSSAKKISAPSIEGIRDALMDQLPVLMTMTFLRDVDAKKIEAGFLEVLKENKVDVVLPPYSDFLNSVIKGGEVKNGDQYKFYFSKEKSLEKVQFYFKGKEGFSFQSDKPGLIRSFMSIWFGKPVDSGLKKLQEQILKSL